MRRYIYSGESLSAPISSTNVGDLYGGGMVIYNWAGGSHGYIAALEDINIPNVTSWGCFGTYPTCGDITNATGITVGTGRINTKAIYDYRQLVSPTGYTTTAAILCVNYSGGGYTDWWLPSRDELILMLPFRKQLNMWGSENGNYVDYPGSGAIPAHTHIRNNFYWFSSSQVNYYQFSAYNFSTFGYAGAGKNYTYQPETYSTYFFVRPMREF